MAEATTEPTVKRRRLAWLRPPEAGPGGTMSIWDHLRELRYRLMVSFAGIVLAAIGCILFYDPLVKFMMEPYYRAQHILQTERGADVLVVNNGVGGAFALGVLICVIGGVVLASPIWLWQLWAFVAPGLVSKEKKYAVAFIAIALPLFLAGCALGYYVWPKGIEVLLGFTPMNMGISNLLEMREFLGMEIKIILVFGLSFLLPVVVVALNMAGVVRGYQLKAARKMVIFGSVVFAAVATPTTDPFSLLALAVPVTLMFFISEFICRAWDKKRGITEETAKEFAIDLDDGK